MDKEQGEAIRSFMQKSVNDYKAYTSIYRNTPIKCGFTDIVTKLDTVQTPIGKKLAICFERGEMITLDELHEAGSRSMLYLDKHIQIPFIQLRAGELQSLIGKRLLCILKEYQVDLVKGHRCMCRWDFTEQS